MDENLTDGGDQVANETPSETEEASTEVATEEGWHDLHECPNGHVEGVHRGLNAMEQGKRAVKYIYGYHCLSCDASWTASEILKL